jgi:hypothetical protein
MMVARYAEIAKRWLMLRFSDGAHRRPLRAPPSPLSWRETLSAFVPKALLQVQ